VSSNPDNDNDNDNVDNDNDNDNDNVDNVSVDNVSVSVNVEMEVFANGQLVLHQNRWLAIPRIDENLICSKDVDETSH
jgi:hypothetical protein